MRFLLDTDWIVSFLKGRQDAINLVAALVDQGFGFSAISYGEAYEGVVGSPDFHLKIWSLNELALLAAF